MATNQLNTTTSSTSLGDTGTPQAAAGSNTNSVQSGQTIQQSGSETLQTGLDNVNTSGASSTGINLNSISASTSSSGTAPIIKKTSHHIAWPLLGFSALFIVIAIALFIGANRSVKSTT